MDCSKALSERIARYQAFYQDPQPGQVLVIVTPYTFSLDYSQWGLPDRPLNSWDFEKDPEAFVDHEVRKMRCFLDHVKDLDNDYIPALSANLGIGIHSAYFSGADIEFGPDTSWAHPVLKDWDNLSSLKPDAGNRWFRILQKITALFAERADGDWAPATFAHFAPMDMANALRGNALFTDLYEEPEKVHKLLDLSADAIVWLEKELRKTAKKIQGGSAVGGMWIPGEALFLSEDGTDLCSAQAFREFGSKYTQKVIDGVGGAYIHHHAKGLHVHSEIAKLRGLKALEISWDPNCPRPIDGLSEIIAWNNGLPLMTRCTVADVPQKIDEIKKGRMILMLDVNNLDEARETVRFIRRHTNTKSG